jgi:hypothetical protein
VGRTLQLLAMVSYIHWRLHGFRSERYFFGIREQVRYSVVLGAGGTLITMVMRLHEFVVSRYYGPEGYAVYSAGCTELPVIQMFTQSVAVVALGQFAVLEQKNDWEGIRQLVAPGAHQFLCRSGTHHDNPVVAAKPIIIFMCTDVYADAAPIFRVNSLIKLGLIFNYTLVLRAMSRNDITMWINVVALLAAPFLLYAGMKTGWHAGGHRGSSALDDRYAIAGHFPDEPDHTRAPAVSGQRRGSRGILSGSRRQRTHDAGRFRAQMKHGKSPEVLKREQFRRQN